MRAHWAKARLSKRRSARPIRVAGAYAAVLLALTQADPFSGAAAEPGVEGTAERTEIRFAFTRSMFTGVNENDARAAMRVYAQTIGDQNGIFVQTEPDLLEGTNGIASALKVGRAQVFALTTPEFMAMESQGLEGPLLMSRIRGSLTENYLLLSRNEGPIQSVEDLKGRSLILGSDVRHSLAFAWLDTLCQEHHLGPAAEALVQIASSPKTSQVVLPVFFAKADACLTTRGGWEIMCELNPQVGKQLRPISESPPFVPAITCFRRGLPESLKKRVIKAVDLSSTRPSYRQLMALFKCDDVIYQETGALDGTREFLTRSHRLRESALEARGR